MNTRDCPTLHLSTNKVKEHRFYCYYDSTKAFSETDIINMLEFFNYNVFVMFGGRVFQQTVGIPMGTN